MEQATLFQKLFKIEGEQTKEVQKGSKWNKRNSSQTCSKWQSKTWTVYTLEACVVQAWRPVQLASDGRTGPDEPELLHNTLYFSFPITMLL